jgi:hypothetical protein
MISVRHEDKLLFDKLQDFLSWKESRRLSQ